jgi:hypothetical protein
METLCNDVLLEVLQNLHPLFWVPLFRNYIETMHHWNVRELFSTPISRMYGSSDINFYFEHMRKKHGETYKEAILSLLNLKYTHKYFRALISRHYNYDMEAMLRILDPNIFQSHRLKLIKVQKEILRRYMPPTHSNEGCFCCGVTLPAWFPSVDWMDPKVIRKQMAKPKDLKKWAIQTKHMIQTGCCSELCYLVHFRTNRIPNKGDQIPYFSCSYCHKLMTSIQACMSHSATKAFKGYWDLETFECTECYVETKFFR